ncbi:hypothetical protein DB32_000289 [Sandaracinus amylolyticus]|uniref:Uncharacterized protein n=1 Tax=Sandaracinus amylolyticus TaxID=927083 RepID=A0A0F6VZ43_9BACT|nr:hypothetical protein DB32_000289 [Sandaracinus amylolyticus]
MLSSRHELSDRERATEPTGTARVGSEQSTRSLVLAPRATSATDVPGRSEAKSAGVSRRAPEHGALRAPARSARCSEPREWESGRLPLCQRGTLIRGIDVRSDALHARRDASDATEHTHDHRCVPVRDWHPPMGLTGTVRM